MNSYDVGGALCDTEDEAAYAVVENFMYGMRSSEEVAQDNTDQVIRELQDADWNFDVVIVGQHPGYSEPKTEDVTPNKSRLREIIEEIIKDAKERI